MTFDYKMDNNRLWEGTGIQLIGEKKYLVHLWGMKMRKRNLKPTVRSLLKPDFSQSKIWNSNTIFLKFAYVQKDRWQSICIQSWASFTYPHRWNGWRGSITSIIGFYTFYSKYRQLCGGCLPQEINS